MYDSNDHETIPTIIKFLPFSEILSLIYQNYLNTQLRLSWLSPQSNQWEFIALKKILFYLGWMLLPNTFVIVCSKRSLSNKLFTFWYYVEFSIPICQSAYLTRRWNKAYLKAIIKFYFINTFIASRAAVYIQLHLCLQLCRYSIPSTVKKNGCDRRMMRDLLCIPGTPLNIALKCFS